MNVVFLLCDTMTREKLTVYNHGNGPYASIKTPNIDKLAKRCVTFDNHYMNSAPCMPARRDLFTGRIEFPWRSWGPRETFDPDWSVDTKDTEIFSCMFTDHANTFDAGGENYHLHFDLYHFIRGHYNDHCSTTDIQYTGKPSFLKQVYRKNRESIKNPDDTYVAKNLSAAAEWIDNYATTHMPFFMYIDEFDPHWPLDPPPPYNELYLKNKELLECGFDGFYHSGSAKDYSSDEIEWLRAQMAGKLTMTDLYIGKLMDALDRQGLWENTAFILTSDHGEYIGEYGLMSKGSGPSYPIFSKIPLLISYPGASCSGNRMNNLTCAVDINATVRDILGIGVPDCSHGESLLPLLSGTGSFLREEVLYGWWGKGFYWTDGRYLLCKAPEKDGPLYQYGTNLGEKHIGLKNQYFDRYENAQMGKFLPHTDRPVYRVPSDGMAYSSKDADFDALFDMQLDPQCEHNLYFEDVEQREACTRRLIKYMHKIEVPHEHFERLGLVPEYR